MNNNLFCLSTTKAKISIFLANILFIASCSQYNEVTNTEFLKFKENFPHLVANISYENLQRSSNLNDLSRYNSEEEVVGVSFPVIDEDIVVGRYIGTDDEKTAVYMDFTNYEEEIIIYDVNDPSKFNSYKMELDAENEVYIPVGLNQSRGGFWCAATCTLGALAIAASDGPFPVMDLLAVSFQAACLADCALKDKKK